MFLARTLVVIPALNEARSIGSTISRWKRLGAASVRVVDNGSTDNTAQTARAAGAEVLQENVRGYGAAAWKGLQDWPAACEWVLFSSADGSDQLSSTDLSAWQAAVDGGAGLVIGDRTFRASARRHLKLTQRLGNWLCVVAIATGWGRRFRDMGSLRLVRKSALDRIRLVDRGFGWNVEMQVKAVEAGMSIAEVPVDYFPREAGSSKISGSVMGTLRAGVGIIRMLIYLYRLKRSPQRAGTASAALTV